MNTIKSDNKPLGIILLSSFYTFGAIVLLILWMINPIQLSRMIAERHGLPSTTGSWILPFIGGLALIMAGGLFSLKRWGYILTVVYLLYFGSVGLVLSAGQLDTVHFGNFIWALLVIVYLLLVRKKFLKDTLRKDL